MERSDQEESAQSHRDTQTQEARRRADRSADERDRDSQETLSHLITLPEMAKLPLLDVGEENVAQNRTKAHLAERLWNEESESSSLMIVP